MSVDRMILALYGLLLLAGAYFGSKAGSKISLYMGIICGVIVLLSVYYSMSNPKLGYLLLTGISGSLTIMFIQRFLQTHKIMPSGMLLLVSLIAFFVSWSQLIKK